MADSETVIWRFLDFTKFVSMLDSNSLYFSRIDTLQDPFEGSQTKKNMESRNNEFPDSLLEFCKKYDPTLNKQKLLELDCIGRSKMRKLMYVNCWHMNQYESAAMWRLYLKSDEGVAIKSTIGRLGLSMKETKNIVFAGKVKYIDYEKEIIPEKNIYLPAFHKRKSFEHENEFRAVLKHPMFEQAGSKLTIYPDIAMPDTMNPENVMWTEDRLGKPGVLVAVNLDALIEKIYVSPTAEDWFLNLVKSISARYSLNKDIVQSSLADKSPIF